jgi:hypothetical protein
MVIQSVDGDEQRQYAFRPCERSVWWEFTTDAGTGWTNGGENVVEPDSRIRT